MSAVTGRHGIRVPTALADNEEMEHLFKVELSADDEEDRLIDDDEEIKIDEQEVDIEHIRII